VNRRGGQAPDRRPRLTPALTVQDDDSSRRCGATGWHGWTPKGVKLWTAAQTLITHYGPHVAIRAAERANELRLAGDIVGIAIWQRILRAIEDLQRDRGEGTPSTKEPVD
jgi:hypothetical protein